MKTAENNEADLEVQEELQSGQPEHSVEKSRAAELLSVILNSRFLKFLAVIGIPFLVDACAGAGKNINETKVALLQTLDREFTGLQADGSSTACADGIGDKDSAEQAAKLRAFLALKGAKANAAVIELFRKNGINAFVEGSIENVTYSEASQQMGDENWTACALAQLGGAAQYAATPYSAPPPAPGTMPPLVAPPRSRTGDAGEMASPDTTPKGPKKTTVKIAVKSKAKYAYAKQEGVKQAVSQLRLSLSSDFDDAYNYEVTKVKGRWVIIYWKKSIFEQSQALGRKDSMPDASGINVVQVDVDGPLPNEMIVETINDRISAISDCWASANRGGSDPNLVNAGMKKIEIRMIVKPNGTVASAKITSNSFKSHGKKLGQCMLKRIKRWRFPKSTKGGSLTYPFVF